MKNKKWNKGANLPKKAVKVYEKVEKDIAKMLKERELKLEDTDSYNFEFEEID